MRLRICIRRIERKLRTKSPFMVIAPTRKEADEQIRKILKDNPDARIGSILIAPPAHKLLKAGL